MSSEGMSSWAAPGPGTVLQDRYRLTRRVGRGGMADVWAAADLVLGRPVAVKLFRFDAPGAERERIEAEMRTLAQLSHPGIVTIYDAGTVSDSGAANGPSSPYLVMELVDGQTLSDRLAAGPLPPEQVVSLAGQLADTLSYLHGKAVVHRDIKPANILLHAEGGGGHRPAPVRARLTDFGIARLVDSTRITAAGMTVGTANYLSPEQVTGDPVGPPADLYALGLVLLECLTGQVAFPGVGLQAATARLHRAPAIPAAVGGPWIGLLTAMTALSPSARPTAAEVASELVRWPAQDTAATSHQPTEVLSGPTAAGPSGTRTLPATPRTGVPVTGRGRWARWWAKPIAWAGVLTAALVIAIIAVLANSGGSGTPAQRPAPSYPSVPGQLGEHLKQLEDAVG